MSTQQPTPGDVSLKYVEMVEGEAQVTPSKGSSISLPDGDYTLTESAGWFDIKGFSIRIHSTDEGIVVDVYDAKIAKSGDFNDALVTSTYAYDAELSTTEAPVDNST